MVITSPVVKEGGNLGDNYTANIFNKEGDQRPISLPINWSGAPANTKSFAVILWHIRGGGDEGIYFVVYNIPGTAKGLPENIPANSTDPKVGIVGKNDKSGNEYEGPGGGSTGIFKYTITVYALSAEPKLPADPYLVSASALRLAMKDIILDTGSMSFNVDYKRPE
jgi:Raf kinase inhibitor-like YbhB/YbcL family protein